MLQQILRDMYVDPDLLAELSEHQKELLFVKMREEQVRRWKVRDEAESKKAVKRVPKPGKKSVEWLQGRDGCEWVWVMGDHKDDQSIEEILERESQEKARILAQEEAGAKRLQQKKQEEEEMKKKEKEEEEKRKKLKEEEERLKKVAEELEMKRKKAEAEAYASLKEMRLQKEKMEREEAEKKRKEEELKEKQEQLRKAKEQQDKERKERERRLQEEEEKRRKELYMSLKEIREKQKAAAMKERDQADKIFQVQLRESKKADKDRSHRARIAREEVRRSRISKDLSGINIEEILDNKKIVPPEEPPVDEKPSLPPRKIIRTPKPTSHQAVVEWFQSEETGRQTGLVTGSNEVAPWFHGIISRQQAEYLLYPKEPGSFLIRVSERIWGYALSLRDKERAKHFLIDASDGIYRFFGQDQIDHSSLVDLINYHKKVPISVMGREMLLTPCGQAADKPPDYEELFSNLKNQNTAL
ncbi:SH2 domain-containing protein 4A-like [Diadema antillarum]|uniref:SH2 domain-containing protein 4A-like n=1 Tax=Diadema antillarum TaxID=105358 RepID=UPI003A84610A